MRIVSLGEKTLRKHCWKGICHSGVFASLPNPFDASWEGFVLEQVLSTQVYDEAYFWATHQGAEIDLILMRGESLIGVEIKRADAPRATPSMRNALQDLGLERIAVVYPGKKRYPISDRIEAVPLAAIANDQLSLCKGAESRGE